MPLRQLDSIILFQPNDSPSVNHTLEIRGGCRHGLWKRAQTLNKGHSRLLYILVRILKNDVVMETHVIGGWMRTGLVLCGIKPQSEIPAPI